MKNYILTIALSLTITTLFAQKRETREVGDFTAVSMGISGEMHLTQGSKNEVILEGDEETLERIETEVVGGKLRIRTENGSWYKNYSKVKVYVTMKEIEGISVSGSGDVFSEGVIKANNIDLGVSGSGNLELNLQASAIDCGISGSGSMQLKGKGVDGDFSISGSGELDARDFEIETLEVHISGSGSADVFVTKELESRISGSGSVNYKGDPDKVANHSSGSGKLRKM